ncbi:MAG: alanine--tRNA ligase [Weeksellaceae bacterium]|nr:alanine--tRNA ligase [Weeksellaceae bacterium]
MNANKIREEFLRFFQSKQHNIVDSAPIVVKNDPTLLFTNAGMNQFKDIFLGNKEPQNPRVVNSQKCLRVSGKHNDLEEVGVDTYHHTMFEMLGNWSFGDYFKKEAIAWSWELLTDVYKLDKDRLYVTVFEGDATDGLPVDEESIQEWKKWVAPDRILMGNKKDNFWEMGDTGPCGPCTEIHVDCRSDEERAATPGAELVNADHPQVIEIWNNVFIEFNRLKDGSLEQLPAQHVDTGMGFERLVRVLQGKTSNYDTDIFSPTIEQIAKIVGEKYTGSDSKEDIAFRVLADHIRAIAFTIADGQLPSNTGAGYVIRRILRRAVRYYYSYLNYKQPLLHQLIPDLAKQFEGIFPELKAQTDFVSKVIREEEEAFLRTLERGLQRIDDIVQSAKGEISGKDAFELYDTFGFPMDLTRLIASENDLEVNEMEFNDEMKKQKDRSRAASVLDTDDWMIINDSQTSRFVGYEDLFITTNVVKCRKVETKGKKFYQIVLEETPFYAESGGQVGDKGVLRFGEEEFEVFDTKKENELILHYVKSIPQNLNQPVTAQVDLTKRLHTMYNHSATHLLHAALKEVLGSHVQQKGSLVSDEILRFDLSHFARITEQELKKVSSIVNENIRENIAVQIKEMPKEEAFAQGATGLFGEKYGDVVRVVTIDPNFSVELCGGTHVPNTSLIGMFIITQESAVAAGVRRIEALTGGEAMRFVFERLNDHKNIVELLKNPNPLASIEKLIQDKTALEKKIESLQSREYSQIAKDLAQKAEKLGDFNFVSSILEADSADALKKIGFNLNQELENFVAVLASDINGKANVAVVVSADLANQGRFDAGKIIKQTVAPIIKGGGGGQKALATAGGQNVDGLAEAIEAVKQEVTVIV